MILIELKKKDIKLAPQSVKDYFNFFDEKIILEWDWDAQISAMQANKELWNILILWLQDVNVLPVFKMKDTDFSSFDFSGLTLNRMEFNETTLNETVFTGGVMNGVNFSRAIATSSNLNDCKMFGVSISNRSDFSNASFVKSVIDGCLFSDSDFSGSVFTDCKISNSQFYYCDLRGVDFSGSEFYAVSVRDCTHDETTIWPNNYSPNRKLDLQEIRSSLDSRLKRLRSRNRKMATLNVKKRLTITLATFEHFEYGEVREYRKDWFDKVSNNGKLIINWNKTSQRDWVLHKELRKEISWFMLVGLIGLFPMSLKFANRSFANLNMWYGCFDGSSFFRVKFHNSSMLSSTFNKTKFIESKFLHSNFSDCSFNEAIFDNCNFSLRLTGVSLANAVFHECLFDECTFIAIDFRQVNMETSTFHKCKFEVIIWDKTTIWPDGFDTSELNGFIQEITNKEGIE